MPQLELVAHDGISQPQPEREPIPQVRLAELLGALSYALDITEGQPPGHCLRSCWIGFHIGRRLGLDEKQLWDLYYVLLLKDIGCSSNAERLCALYAHDDRVTKRDFARVDTDSLEQLARFVFRHTAPQRHLRERIRHIIRLLRHGERLANELVQTRCERGASIAARLGFSRVVADGIRSLDEHWNGKGRPLGLCRDAIPLASRTTLLAQVADVFHQVGGPESARSEVNRRRGTWFDPNLVDVFNAVAQAPDFWKSLKSSDLPARVLRLEPSSDVALVGDGLLDEIALAFAQVVDAKSHYTYGHSERVGRYAEAIAERLGFEPKRRRWVRRGALLHDLGKLGVSNTVLDKPERLNEREWHQIRRHPGLTEKILSRIGPFGELARVAGAHHERLDGGGYPRGLSDDAIGLETRIITTADVFDALTAERPYRAAMPVERALAIMEDERGFGIDPDCLDIVLASTPELLAG